MLLLYSPLLLLLLLLRLPRLASTATMATILCSDEACPVGFHDREKILCPRMDATRRLGPTSHVECDGHIRCRGSHSTPGKVQLVQFSLR